MPGRKPLHLDLRENTETRIAVPLSSSLVRFFLFGPLIFSTGNWILVIFFIYQFFLFHKETQSASFFFHFDKRCMKFLPYYAPTFLWLVWFFLTPLISFCSRQKFKMMEGGSLNEIIFIFFYFSQSCPSCQIIYIEFFLYPFLRFCLRGALRTCKKGWNCFLQRLSCGMSIERAQSLLYEIDPTLTLVQKWRSYPPYSLVLRTYPIEKFEFLATYQRNSHAQ